MQSNVVAHVISVVQYAWIQEIFLGHTDGHWQLVVHTDAKRIEESLVQACEVELSCA